MNLLSLSSVVVLPFVFTIYLTCPLFDQH
jgi:hypothetical protein